MTEVLKQIPQEETGKQVAAGIKDVVARNPTKIEDAVRAYVTRGILGPLEEFGAELNYSPEQIAFLSQYARDTSQFAVQREVDLIASSPLFQLDVALAELDTDEASLARNALRTAQQKIKDRVKEVVASQGEELSTDEVIDNVLQDKNGLLRIRLPGGRMQKIGAIRYFGW